MSRRLLPWTIALRPYCSLFSLFVVSEFALGYVTERSISAGVISIFAGLFSTAFGGLFFGGSRRGKDDSGS